MSYFGYERTWLSYIEGLKNQLLARPLVLGGVASSGGGAGGPSGGFVGKLPQTAVTYDTDEFALSTIPISGSLLDNLNHIRYRISGLENAPTASGIGHIVENETTPMTQRSKLSFQGTVVNVTDDAANDRTIVTISGGSGSGHTIEDETTPMNARTKLSFQGSAVTVTDDSGNDRTIVTISGGGGGDTTAKYVVGEAASGLSNEIVVPYFNIHPEVPGRFGSLFSEEFNTTDLSAWTWTSAPTTYDAHTTIPSHLSVVTHHGNTAVDFYRSVAVGTSFDVRFLMSGGIRAGTTAAVMAGCYIASDTQDDRYRLSWYWNSTYYNLNMHTMLNNGSFISRAYWSYVMPDRSWLRFLCVSGETNVSCQYSSDGYGWVQVGAWDLGGIDVQKIGLTISAQAATDAFLLCDCIRIQSA